MGEVTSDNWKSTKKNLSNTIPKHGETSPEVLTITENFKLAMGMGAEALSRSHPIFIYDSQSAELVKLVVLIRGE